MAVYKVIDVSDWQGKINWAKVKADGVVGAIIRYADGKVLDKRFNENMIGAKANGIHVGSYIFSRARTKAEAEEEAARLYKACRPYDPDMPLYIDLEVNANRPVADAVAAAYLNKMASLGGRGGVYANLNWWNNYLKATAKNYSASPFWIAQYYSKMEYKNPVIMGMWQYTSSGKVDGIPARVDMNRCYVPYWENAPKPVPKKSIDEIAKEVIAGKWGNGDERVKRLKEAGYDPSAVQKRVNEMLAPKKSIDELAHEVIDGKWGKGDERKKRLTAAGYDYDAVQKRVNEILMPAWTVKANAWARKIAADNSYHYVKWSSDKKTHMCPVCNNFPKGKYHGWNCIGFTYACWHHGGGLKNKCNDGVISNQVAEKILQASDAEALKIAQEHIGLKDIKVIRNKRGIPKKDWRAGDICMYFSGGKYIHNYFYMGDGKIAESTGSSGKIPNDEQIRIKSYSKKSAQVIIRYTGK